MNGHVITKKPSAAELPKLPVPKLEDTCKRYLTALEGLQDEGEHAKTKAIVQDFLSNGEGAKWQAKLERYNEGVESYIEEFWCEYPSYRSVFRHERPP
jgi:carnitine O-acetyltransferase